MATEPPAELPGQTDDIAPISIVEEMKTSYLDYAMSVIVSRALPDVRDAIARLKVPLATYGGVEISLYTADDQLTLTPQLELFIYARSDRWLYLLQGKGLEERAALADRSWRAQGWDRAPAPTLSAAIATAAERLSLTQA